MKPPFLKQGDKVAIVAPAKRIDKLEIDFAIKIFQSWGLEVIVGDTIGTGIYLFSDNDENRVADFQNMINNQEVKAIFSARGGYGCVRIIDAIDFSALQKHPKWLIGFSDFTVFHTHIFKTLNLSTLHASMPVFFEKNTKAAISSLKSVLFGDELTYKVISSFPELCVSGSAKGVLIGGNLSVLYSLCGSSSALKRGEYILFLEDLCEYFYHVDRMMQNLKRNAVFENVKAVIVGSFTDMQDGALPFGKNAYEVVFEYFKDLNIPVFTGFPAGHNPDNRALIFGEEVELKVSGASLTLQMQ